MWYRTTLEKCLPSEKKCLIKIKRCWRRKRRSIPFILVPDRIGTFRTKNGHDIFTSLSQRLLWRPMRPKYPPYDEYEYVERDPGKSIYAKLSPQGLLWLWDIKLHTEMRQTDFIGRVYRLYKKRKCILLSRWQKKPKCHNSTYDFFWQSVYQ